MSGARPGIGAQEVRLDGQPLARRGEAARALGAAFSDYRAGVYARGFDGRRDEMPLPEVVALCRMALEHLSPSAALGRIGLQGPLLYDPVQAVRIQAAAMLAGEPG